MADGLAVLLVEDDHALLRTLGDIIGRRGYRPLNASSGRQALDVAAEARPAIALVDLRLPDMDGMEVIGRLHRVSALTEAIVLTGNASVDSAVDWLATLSRQRRRSSSRRVLMNSPSGLVSIGLSLAGASLGKVFKIALRPR